MPHSSPSPCGARDRRHRPGRRLAQVRADSGHVLRKVPEKVFPRGSVLHSFLRFLRYSRQESVDFPEGERCSEKEWNCEGPSSSFEEGVPSRDFQKTGRIKRRFDRRRG